jgi:MFS family permease
MAVHGTLRRARLAVWYYFALCGAVMATWTARIPAVKSRIGLSDGTLAVGLLATSAGAMVSMQLAGRLVDRFGSRRVVVPAGIALGVALLGPGFAGTLPALVAALFCYGACYGLTNVAMNTHALTLQRRYGRPIMTSFHAVFSAGGLVGAALGGLAARADLTAAGTFTAVGLPLAALALAAGAWLLPTTELSPTALFPTTHPANESSGAAAVEAAGGAAPAGGVTADGGAEGGVTPGRGRRRRIEPAILFMGVLSVCCLVGEGSMADWSSVYLHDDLSTSAAFAAAGYAVFCVAMAAGRLVGDRLAAAVGPVALVRVCGTLAALGLAGGLLAGDRWLGLVGFGLFGAGLSCIMPQVFNAAGTRDPVRAGRNLALVTTIGYVGFLAGPVAIGGIASLIGLPLALGIPALLALFVAATATALHQPSTTPAMARTAR